MPEFFPCLTTKNKLRINNGDEIKQKTSGTNAG